MLNSTQAVLHLRWTNTPA